MPGQVERIRGYCVQCQSKCAVVGIVDDGRFVRVEPDRAHPEGGLCAVGSAGPEMVYSPRRLQYPLKRTHPKSADDPGWVRVSWDEALADIAARLAAIRDEAGGEAIAVSRGAPGATGSQDYYPWLGRLANLLGAPNTISTTHQCQWARDNGSAYTYGVGAPPPQFEQAELIVIWGANPAASWLNGWRRIAEAVRRGASLIVVDPRRTLTAQRADLWLAVEPGTDSALMLGLARVLIEDGLYDADFVAHWTNAPFLVDAASGRLLRESDLRAGGAADRYLVVDAASGALAAVDPALHPRHWGVTPRLDAAVADLPGADGSLAGRSVFALLRERVAPFTLDAVERLTGVPAAQVLEATSAIGTIKPLAYWTFNGVEQHTNTLYTNRAMCALYALTGNFDVRGGNALRPAVPTNAPDAPELLAPEQRAKRLGLRERPLGAPRVSAQAYNVYESILTGEPYRTRALLAFGSNVILQNGNSRRAREALEQLEFYVQVDLFETPSGRCADYLLPAASAWEVPAIRSHPHGAGEGLARIEYRPPVVPPRHEARPDVDVIFDLACRLGYGEHFFGGDVEAALRWQVAPSGVDLDTLRATPGGVDRPVEQRYRKYATEDPATGRAVGFHTPSRKVELYSETFLAHGYDPLPRADDPALGRRARPDLADEYPLVLISAKVRSFSHSQHRGLPSLRKRDPEPYAELHPDTAAAHGIVEGEPMAITTWLGEIRAKARLTPNIRPGVVATQTGWWEPCDELGLPGHDPYGPTGANFGLIVGYDVKDELSGSIPGKSYRCRVRPLAVAAAAPSGWPTAVGG
jgi:anaerobic selenocysteine-containing dehydrogenase